MKCGQPLASGPGDAPTFVVPTAARPPATSQPELPEFASLAPAASAMRTMLAAPELELQETRPPRAGAPFSLIGRIRWPGGDGKALLEVDCPLLGVSQGHAFAGDQWSPFALDVRPPEAGMLRFLFRVESQEGGDYRGEHFLQVDPASESGPVIQIHNQQTNDARIAVGQEANINVHVAGRSDESWRREILYVPVALQPAGAGGHTATLVKRPWRPFTANALLASRLSLRIRVGNSVRNVCLLGGTSFALGKQRGSDIVLRLLPSSPDLEKLWGRISRHHADLRFTPEGAEWQNAECPNGTVVDGRVLGAKQSIPLRPGLHVRPSDVMELRCTLFRESPLAGQDDAYQRMERQLGGAAAPFAAVGPLSAMRLNRVGNLDGLEEYVLVQRACSLGSDAGNAIVISHPSVSMRHAVIIYNAHGFWLEPVQRQFPTRSDGEQIPLHRLVHLQPGMSPLQIGEVEIGVSGMQQWFVDVNPA